MLDRPASNASLSARDIAYHMHPFTNARRLESEGPFVITRGNGIRIYDEEGRDYIDGLAGLWCASLGFSEKRLAEAAYKQMLELPYASTFGQRSHPKVIELAEKLISLDAGADVEGVLQQLRAPRRTTAPPSWSGTTTTRSAGRARRRSSGG